MRHNALGTILVLTAALAATSCGPNTAFNGTRASTPVRLNASMASGIEQPTPPLILEKPPAPPALLDNRDLRDVPEGELQELAFKAEQGQDYPHAAILQYWLVQRTNSSHYNLACYLSRTGKVDPAFYWLQVAGLAGGLDAAHADRDEDLEALRADSRWPQVRDYLSACNRYFEAVVPPRTVLRLPKSYVKGTPIPAVVWLHGLGSHPDDFLDDLGQRLADETNIAIVGVSATVARGPESFVWAEEAERDAARIRDGLSGMGDRVTIKPGHVILLGFSQGAQVGLETAVRHPEEFAGAIALSPGAVFHLQDVKPSSLLAKRGYVVSCGAREQQGIVLLTKQDADWARAAKARIIEREYAGISAHALPLDFSKRFPEWVKFIEQTRGE